MGFEDKNYIANVGDVFIHTAVIRQIETYLKKKKHTKYCGSICKKNFVAFRLHFIILQKGFIVPFIITIPNDERLIF